MKKHNEPPQRQNRCRNFTLMELMIVLLILGLIAALVAPNFLKKAEKARYQTAKLQVELLSNAVKEFYLDTGEYPTELRHIVESDGSDRWDGPYIDQNTLPKDPWGEPYIYEFPGSHGRFDIYSHGADKSPGGEGYDADVGNWEE